MQGETAFSLRNFNGQQSFFWNNDHMPIIRDTVHARKDICLFGQRILL